LLLDQIDRDGSNARPAHYQRTLVIMSNLEDW
jgi:hypothetical protein